MDEKKKKQLAGFEKIINGGKSRFVIVYGVIFFGCGTGLFTVLFDSIIASAAKPFVFEDYLVKLIVWPIAGLCWGLYMWSWISKRHGRLKAELVAGTDNIHP